jgi:hypothetical protein
MTARLLPGIWTVIFIGDDAPQALGAAQASIMDTAVTLRRNVSGAKDIDMQASFQIKITDLNNKAAHYQTARG